MAFSEGLKLCKRYWMGPIVLALKLLKRSCGPEEDMVFHEGEDNFNRRVDAIVEAIRQQKKMPPLIVKYEDGVYELNDGNHRLEAFIRMKMSSYYVILWDSVNQLKSSHGHYAWLQENLGDYGLESFDAGHMKTCYKFKMKDQDKLLMVSHKKDDLLSNPWLLNHLKKHGIPVKKVHIQGSYEDRFLEVTDFIEGQSVRDNPLSRKEIMMKIHQVPCESTKGYGWIQKSGHGQYESLKAFLEAFFINPKEGYWKDFHHLFEIGLDAQLYQKCYDEIIRLIPYSENYRSIVHGDFHDAHVLFQEERVAGVIDWDQAMYFDKVYDWIKVTKDHHDCPYKEEAHFQERIRAMTLFSLLDAYRFYFKNKDQRNYEHMKREIETLLEEDRE